MIIKQSARIFPPSPEIRSIAQFQNKNSKLNNTIIFNYCTCQTILTSLQKKFQWYFLEAMAIQLKRFFENLYKTKNYILSLNLYESIAYHKNSGIKKQAKISTELERPKMD